MKTRHKFVECTLCPCLSLSLSLSAWPSVKDFLEELHLPPTRMEAWISQRNLYQADYSCVPD
jgi:hypothetical protein